MPVSGGVRGLKWMIKSTCQIYGDSGRLGLVVSNPGAAPVGIVRTKRQARLDFSAPSSSLRNSISARTLWGMCRLAG
jgi:hypothetical protein